MVPALAIHAADNAAQLSKEVSIFTNGSQDIAEQLRAMSANSPFKIELRSVARLFEDSGVVNVEFTDEGSKSVFLTHTPLTVPQGPFVQQLGAHAVINR